MMDTEGAAGDEKPADPGSPSSEPATSETPAEPQPEDWPESAELQSPEVSAHEMASYARTLRRIERLIVVAGVVCALAALWPLGWQLAAGILFGTLLGAVNFRWLAASVNAIGERIVHVESRERGAAVVVRGVGRIFLMALAAYVIFICSVPGLVGFLTGLAMPVVAIMCEAVYEFVASNRRSS
jgi:hypothetical protein